MFYIKRLPHKKIYLKKRRGRHICNINAIKIVFNCGDDLHGCKWEHPSSQGGGTTTDNCPTKLLSDR